MQFLFVPQIISQWIHWPTTFLKLPAVLFLDLTCTSGGSLICTAPVLWGNSADWESWKLQSNSTIATHNPQAIMSITAALGFKTKAVKVNKTWVSWGGDTAILKSFWSDVACWFTWTFKNFWQRQSFFHQVLEAHRRISSPSQGMLSWGNTKWQGAQPFGLKKVLQTKNCSSSRYNDFQNPTIWAFSRYTFMLLTGWV